MKARGFSIAEVLIACTMLCGISVCLLAVWALHARATTQSRDIMVASAWAEQVMEEQLSKGYTCVDDPASSHPPFRVKHIVEDQEIESEYLWGVYVVDYAEPTNPGLKLVTVEVAWENGGVWRQIRAATRLSWQG